MKKILFIAIVLFTLGVDAQVTVKLPEYYYHAVPLDMPAWTGDTILVYMPAWGADMIKFIEIVDPSMFTLPSYDYDTLRDLYIGGDSIILDTTFWTLETIVDTLIYPPPDTTAIIMLVCDTTGSYFFNRYFTVDETEQGSFIDIITYDEDGVPLIPYAYWLFGYFTINYWTGEAGFLTLDKEELNPRFIVWDYRNR